MAGLLITIEGVPVGDRQLVYRLSAEPADLEPQEVAAVLRLVADQLEAGRMTQA